MIKKSSKRKNKKNSKNKLKPLQKLSLFFFNRPRKTALIWLIVTVFGFVSYTTLLKREGFPAIQTPYALVNGSYVVNDAAKVDEKVAGPVDKFILKQDGVKSVSSSAQGNFFTIAVQYEDGVDAKSKSKQIQVGLNKNNILPKNAVLQIKPFEFGFTDRGDDLVVSLYSKKNNSDTKELVKKGEQLAEYFRSKNIADVESVSLINPYEKTLNQLTGKPELTQKTFDRFGSRQENKNNFYNSVGIGFSAKQGSDNLKLDQSVQDAIRGALKTDQFKGYSAKVSASYAPQIKAQISELQRVLLEGLIAVLVVGSIVIAIRASLVTVLSMLTVLATVNGLLYLIGYSLNTITLFTLILGLALIIDDTIIMVEALDAQRKRQKTAGEAVKVATGKVSRAMISATLTAVLSFAPLIFVGGILGEFIRAIPVTMMSALIISLFAALIFIPLFARYLLLNKGQVGSNYVGSFAAGIEHNIAEIIAKPMLKTKHSKPKLAAVSLTAILFSFIFIGTGGWFFQKVTFNIFPSSKDANELSVTLNFPANTDIKQAEKAADSADKIIAKTTGRNFDQASYYGQATIRSATLYVYLTDYSEREITSPQIVNNLEKNFKEFNQASVTVSQLDAGPPASEFALRIDSSKNRTEALKLSKDIANYLETTTLKRPDDSVAKIKSTQAGTSDSFTREDGKQFVTTTASFEDNDTTTLVNLAKEAVQNEFTGKKLAKYGFTKDDLKYDFGQEDENQDSFKTLALAFPLVLLAIYVLLIVQFRSFIQPLFIFMAIPFSLFGITLGLYLTDNPFSFFAMLGFFALIGLSIKNTILLTDFANQSRRAGLGAVDAIHEALAERFRPLIATSLTAVVSLVPLYLTSPFWESLTVVLIFGLLSSTFLVVTVFPYYYLAGEFLRSGGRKVYRKLRRL